MLIKKYELRYTPSPYFKNKSISTVRTILRNERENIWIKAMGNEKGDVYRKIWSILEG